jgi:menaquinone-dependent protoporphyrinogen oxidase
MPAHILVAYASEFGTTQRIAQVIGDTLHSPGVTVDVRLLTDVRDLTPYTAAVVGGAIYNGAWLPEAVHFVQFYEAMLSQIPVAYFAACMTLVDDSPERRKVVLSYLDPVRKAAPSVRPVDIGLFAGQMRYRNLPFSTRILFWLRTGLPTGDYRNWRAIRDWALDVRPALLPR